MKRKIIAFTIGFIFMFSTNSYAVDISIDDTNIEFCGHTGIPFIDSNNRTQVPLRIAMESIGVEVDWIQSTKTAVLKKGDILVDVTIGKSYIIKNGEKIKTDTSAIIKDSRTYMPIRSVIEAFNGDVAWRNETHTVIIDSQTLFGVGLEKLSIPVCVKNHPGDFTIMTDRNYPGNVLVLKIDKLNAEDSLRIGTDASKIDTRVFENGDNYVAILPIDLYASIGSHDITATFNEGKDNEYKITRAFNIKSRSFETQYLVVSESLNKANNNYKADLEYVNIVKPARTISSLEKLWEGEFIMPASGRLTTDFAEIRYINNMLSSSRHSGIDLAAPIGTPIKAPNNGRVTLAAVGLLSTGNTIVIDHGLGLFTSYYHLNSLNVQVGELVKKGDIIGTVGTTGFSTGSHLHYGVSIYNTNVNTYQPLEGIID